MKPIYALFLVLLVFSCAEEKDKIIPKDEHPEFYIKANIDGDSIIYVKEYPNEHVNGTFRTYEGDPNSSSLSISRLEKNFGSEGDYISIFVTRIQLDSIITPYNIPQIPTYPIPYFEIQFGNLSTQNTNAPDDSVTYLGTTLSGSDINLSILDKENDIILGTFSGELKTNTGLIVIIENGEFRSNIIRDEK